MYLRDIFFSPPSLHLKFYRNISATRFSFSRHPWALCMSWTPLWGMFTGPAVCLSDAAHAADACMIHTRHGRVVIDKVRSLCEAGVLPLCCWTTKAQRHRKQEKVKHRKRSPVKCIWYSSFLVSLCFLLSQGKSSSLLLRTVQKLLGWGEGRSEMRVSNVFFLVAEGRVAQSFCSGKQEREFFTQPSFIFQPSLCETNKKRRRRIKQCTVGARSHAVLLLSQALMYLHHSHLANSTSVFSTRNAMVTFIFLQLMLLINVIPTNSQPILELVSYRLRNLPLRADVQITGLRLPLFRVPVVVYNTITNVRRANGACAWTQITFFFKANRKLNCPHMMADGFMFVHFRLRSPLSRSNTIGEGYSDGQPMETRTLSIPTFCRLPTDSVQRSVNGE